MNRTRRYCNSGSLPSTPLGVFLDPRVQIRKLTRAFGGFFLGFFPQVGLDAFGAEDVATIKIHRSRSWKGGDANLPGLFVGTKQTPVNNFVFSGSEENVFWPLGSGP